MPHTFTPAPQNPIILGVSSCLLGAKTRYNGEHSKNEFVTGILGEFFEFEPVCPETGIGLATPREPVRLVGNPSRPRAIGVNDSRLDITDKLEAYGESFASNHAGKLSGFILKSRSPSCGIRVEVVGDGGRSVSAGTGIFARQIIERIPSMPVIEESCLDDEAVRKNFVEKAVAYNRWRKINIGGLTKTKLIRFHDAYNLVLLSHHQGLARKLDKLVLRLKAAPSKRFRERYFALFMDAMSRRATTSRHAKVLKRLISSINGKMNDKERAKLQGLVEKYRIGRVPLSAPVSSIKRRLRRNGDTRFDNQVYLNPWPAGRSLLRGA